MTGEALPQPDAAAADLALAEAERSAAAASDTAPPVRLDYQPPTPQPLGSIKARAVRGSLWTMLAFGAGQALRLVSSPVLAYLLTPDDFGTVALVMVFVYGLMWFTDVGIEQAVIQNPRGDDEAFLNTAWTIHAIRGVILWLGCCAIAYPVYWFYADQPNARHLLTLLPVAGLQPLFTGLNSTRIFSLNRHLQLGRVTLLNLAQQVVAVAIQTAIAFRWPTPWSVILGGVSSSAFVTLASHVWLPGIRNRFCLDAGVRRELTHFGKWIMVSTLCTFLAMQIDRPLLGKLSGEAWLGLYMVALNLVRLPADVITRLTGLTLFPALARSIEERPDDLGRVFRHARSLILAVCVALSAAVVLGGPIFVALFYKSPWHVAGDLARWATVGGWFLLLQLSADRALLALGKTRAIAMSNIASLIVTVAGAFVGRYFDQRLFGHADGIVGFVIGTSMGRVAGHIVIQVALARNRLPIVRQDALYSLVLAAACAAGIGLPRLFPGYPDHRLSYDLMVGVAVCAATCAWAGLKVLRGIR